MKKKVVALALAAVLTLSMSMTAFAASSTTTSNSGDQSGTSSTTTVQSVETVVANTAAGEEIEPSTVKVAVKTASGTAQATTLDAVIEDKQSDVKASVVAIASAGEGAAVAAADILTVAPTEFFTATIEALSSMKGSEMVVNNCGTVKTLATAKDALGNTIASAGVIEYVTSGALILLQAVDEDGTVEYVEGMVDPVTGAVMGAFSGTPVIITVLVLA